MAPHFSSLAWKIPWAEEPGRLQFMESLRVRHDWATSFSLFTFMYWRRKWQPTPVFLAWRIAGTGEPGGLPSMRWHRVGQGWSDLAAAAAVPKLCPTSVIPWTVALQAHLSLGFSRQEYWSGLPFPSPGDHPNPGIKPCIARWILNHWITREVLIVSILKPAISLNFSVLIC